MDRTVYISTGNSDDKLSQRDWANLVGEIESLLLGFTTHGRWFSLPNSAYQNACWCVALPPGWVEPVRRHLKAVASKYSQDSITWAEVEVEFLTPDV